MRRSGADTKDKQLKWLRQVEKHPNPDPNPNPNPNPNPANPSPNPGPSQVEKDACALPEASCRNAY